jgi:hypothetical protein
MLVPVPAAVPPHEPVNHSHTAPVPSEPPVTVSVLFVPKQVLLFVMSIAVGAPELVPRTSQRSLVGLFPQALDAYTTRIPSEVPEVTVTVLVPCPAVIVPEPILHV